MHKRVKLYCEQVKEEFPRFFTNVHVLDVGSLDVNGNNRYLFDKSTYIGVDIKEGKNVDIVCPCHKLDFKDESFDVIISTEMLEHDPYWYESLRKMSKMLKPDGLLLLSCATPPRAKHYIQRRGVGEEWIEYYRNIEIEDLVKGIDVYEQFAKVNIDMVRGDLRFHAIKLRDYELERKKTQG